MRSCLRRAPSGPWGDSGHEAAEGLHVGHANVAAVPVGADLHLHVFLEVAFGHVAEHGCGDGVGEIGPVPAVGLGEVGLEEADVFAGGQEEGSGAEVGCGFLVDDLAGDGFLAYGLHVAHGGIGLEGCAGEVFPAFEGGVGVALIGEDAVVDAPEEAVSEECGAGGLASGGVVGVHHGACPIAAGLLEVGHGGGEATVFVEKEGAVLPVGGEVGEHFGEAGEHPSVAAGPEVFLAVGGGVGRVDVFAVAEVEAGVAVEHDAVADLDIVVEALEVA